jgi:hypothetical protein
MAGLQQSLARQQCRRRGYRAGPPRVSWDGGKQQQIDPMGGVDEPCRVPLSASYLEIAGDDTEGTLLLAVVPLPDPAEVEAEGTQHLSVTLEGGQTVALTMALDRGSDGQMPAYVIQLTYAASTAPATLPPKPHPETSIPPQEGGLPTH